MEYAIYIGLAIAFFSGGYLSGAASQMGKIKRLQDEIMSEAPEADRPHYLKRFNRTR